MYVTGKMVRNIAPTIQNLVRRTSLRSYIYLTMLDTRVWRPGFRKTFATNIDYFRYMPTYSFPWPVV